MSTPNTEQKADTPRTDKIAYHVILNGGCYVRAEFARELERELAAQSARLAEVEKQRDNLQESYQKWAAKWETSESRATAAEQKLKEVEAKLEDEDRSHGITIDQRDAAENAADKLASEILGEPIDWSDHDAKWQEAHEVATPEHEVAALRAELAALKAAPAAAKYCCCGSPMGEGACREGAAVTCKEDTRDNGELFTIEVVDGDQDRYRPTEEAEDLFRCFCQNSNISSNVPSNMPMQREAYMAGLLEATLRSAILSRHHAATAEDTGRLSLLEWLGETAFFPDWDDNGFWHANINGRRVIGTTLRQFCDAAIAAKNASPSTQ